MWWHFLSSGLPTQPWLLGTSLHTFYLHIYVREPLKRKNNLFVQGRSRFKVLIKTLYLNNFRENVHPQSMAMVCNILIIVAEKKEFIYSLCLYVLSVYIAKCSQWINLYFASIGHYGLVNFDIFRLYLCRFLALSKTFSS